jgi:hypothetical protein
MFLKFRKWLVAKLSEFQKRTARIRAMISRMAVPLALVFALAACADMRGVSLPLDGILAGPCAPAYVRAYWHF